MVQYIYTKFNDTIIFLVCSDRFVVLVFTIFFFLSKEEENSGQFLVFELDIQPKM